MELQYTAIIISEGCIREAMWQEIPGRGNLKMALSSSPPLMGELVAKN
jgi:hypothetical protein